MFNFLPDLILEFKFIKLNQLFPLVPMKYSLKHVKSGGNLPIGLTDRAVDSRNLAIVTCGPPFRPKNGISSQQEKRLTTFFFF